MYENLLKNDYVKIMQNNALNILKLDRNIYNDIFNYIVKFTIENSLIVSNIDILLNRQKYWTDINIYTVDPDNMAKKLITELCKKFDKLFQLKILDPEKHYVIEYNLRKICDFRPMVISKKYKIDDFIDPIKMKYEDNDIILMPHIIEIINLYHILYTPEMAEEWPLTLANIKDLEEKNDKILDNLPNVNLLNITQSLIDYKSPLMELSLKKTPFPSINKHLLEMVRDTNYLLLYMNEYNINIIAVPKTIDIDIITIISQNNIEFDIELITKFLRQYVSYAISYKENEMYLPDEDRMKKTFIYLMVSDGKNVIKKHIMSIYNNTSYELINYTTCDTKLGQFKIVDPIAEIRFIYIDIWKGLISYRNHKLGRGYFDIKLKKFIALLKSNREKINISEYKVHYTGVNINLFIEKKIKALQRPVSNKFSYYCYEIV